MSNLCLKYVEVSFYQISRSLGIPMIPLITFFCMKDIMHRYLLFGEKSSVLTVLSCITVVVGLVHYCSLINSYILGIKGEINFSLTGTLFGIGASLIGTFYTIYLKHFMDDIVKNQWELSFYNNFNSSLILPVMVLYNREIPILVQHKSELTFSYFFWIFISGLIGLLVGLTTQLQIKYTSTLSHNISGVMKNCIQTFMGAAFYRTPLTLKGICGVILVVGGSLMYALERIRINKADEQLHKEQKTKLLNKDIENESQIEASVIDE